ncbi:MAG TPA: TIGR03435 family protein [Bryobacteraceae bacterium]|jgi:uncharacterized protein (TIGR03435 family)
MKLSRNARWIFTAALSLAPLRAAGPQFEVASVRVAPEPTVELARAGKLHQGMTIDRGRVDIGGTSLNDLLQLAFRVRRGQITGPAWMTSTRFDIVAKIPEGATEEQVPEMLQALLADRFNLTVHRETKDQPGYALTVAKGGIKATEVSADAAVPSLLPPPDPSAAPLLTQTAPAGGSIIHMTRTPDGGGVVSGPNFPTVRLLPQVQHGGLGAPGLHLEAPKINCAQLATLLTSIVEQQVVDMTQSKSFFQLSLDLSLEDAMAELRSNAAGGQPPPPQNPMEQALVAAVQKLGLKLDARKLPTQMIVVDHLEKTPSEN